MNLSDIFTNDSQKPLPKSNAVRRFSGDDGPWNPEHVRGIICNPYYAVASGAWIHVHSHPNDEAWNVIAGELEIKIAVETRVAGPGCAVVVPPEIRDHMAEKTSPDFSR